jgi:aspartate aminotransferase-like enzyme
MTAAVRLILDEGLAHRFRRHEVAATALRAGLAAMSLEMFPDPSLWSNTVSCVRTPTDVDPESVVACMRDDHRILIGTGLAELRTTTLRIGTMGITASPMYVLPTLGALELTLRDLGYKAEPGAGVAAAQQAFAEA